MNVAVSTRIDSTARRFEEANAACGHGMHFVEPPLTRDTAVPGAGFDAICSFVNDRLDDEALAILRIDGLELVGFDLHGRVVGISGTGASYHARQVPAARLPRTGECRTHEGVVGALRAAAQLLVELDIVSLHASRLSAMQSASPNFDHRQTALPGEFRRRRQEVITAELP